MNHRQANEPTEDDLYPFAVSYKGRLEPTMMLGITEGWYVHHLHDGWQSAVFFTDSDAAHQHARAVKAEVELRTM